MKRPGGEAKVCHWPGKGAIPCDISCHFMQPEGFCFLATLAEEWPEAFTERILTDPQEMGGNVLRFEHALTLEVWAGFSQDRVRAVLSGIGKFNARA